MMERFGIKLPWWAISIRDIIWREEVEDKIITKHGVWPNEAEQALANRLHVRFMEQKHRLNKDLYAAFGQTDAGRYLTIYFLLKSQNTALIVTAREMTTKEIRAYGKRK